MDLLNAVLAVFSHVGEWIIEQLGALQALFWVEGQGGFIQLTMLGMLAVVGLGISVVFLLIRVIQNFLHFRG